MCCFSFSCYVIRTSTDDIKSLRLITAIKTPYLPDGRFDLEAYDDLVNMQIEGGADGVIVGGTTGEGQLMSWDEHIMLIGHTINCFGSSIKVVRSQLAFKIFYIFHIYSSVVVFFHCYKHGVIGFVLIRLNQDN